MSRVKVVGIVNRTPDSFYDRGATYGLPAAVAAGVDAWRAGADWVDVGGCPIGRAHEVSAAEEITRVVPVIAELVDSVPFDAPVMVDTFRAEVARAAIEAGAQGINDTSGLYDPEMAAVAAEAGVLLVVAHSRQWPDLGASRPPYVDVVAEVRDDLLATARKAITAGVHADRIVIDPGHDLWKSTAESLDVTRRLSWLAALPFEVMAALSHKTFIADTVGPDLTGPGTVAANAIAIWRGAAWIRVHDVAAGVAAARMVEAIRGETK